MKGRDGGLARRLGSSEGSILYSGKGDMIVLCEGVRLASGQLQSWISESLKSYYDGNRYTSWL